MVQTWRFDPMRKKEDGEGVLGGSDCVWYVYLIYLWNVDMTCFYWIVCKIRDLYQVLIECIL